MTITAMRNLKLRDETQLNFGTDSRLRLLTIVRLRWLGVLGQIFAVGPFTSFSASTFRWAHASSCIAMSAWVNVYLAVRYPGRHRLSIAFATSLLAYDIVQLASLLYLTGGIDNPFTMLIVAPVAVSAATLLSGRPSCSASWRSRQRRSSFSVHAAAVVSAHVAAVAAALPAGRAGSGLRLHAVPRPLCVAAHEGRPADVRGAFGDRARSGPRAEAVMRSTDWLPPRPMSSARRCRPLRSSRTSCRAR